jgi:hypothetical protein
MLILGAGQPLPYYTVNRRCGGGPVHPAAPACERLIESFHSVLKMQIRGPSAMPSA